MTELRPKDIKELLDFNYPLYIKVGDELKVIDCVSLEKGKIIFCNKGEYAND